MLGVEEGLKLVKATPGAECFIILNGGGKVRSDGFKKIEVPRDTGTPQSNIALADGAPWPQQFIVDIDIPVKHDSGVPGERPYVAVWIEDDQKLHVTTLAVWGNEERWLRQLDHWWKIGKTDTKWVPTVTKPTRDAGHYTLAWNGKDRQGRTVPQGKYTVWVEVSYEHGTRLGKSTVIDCGSDVKNVSIDATTSFDAIKLNYAQAQAAK